MKVLHVLPDLSPESGGPVTAVPEMVRAQVRAGVEARLLASDHRKSLPNAVRRADLVHIHTVWSCPTWAAGKTCRRFGVPYILRPCGMLDRWCMSQRPLRKRLYLALFGRATLEGARAIHWTSAMERDNSRLPYKLRGEVVVPLGVAAEAEPPAASRKPVLLFLGRLHPKKQPEVALQAFHRIHGEFPEASLVIAGAGKEAYVRRLKALSRKLGLEGRVRFPGHLDRGQVREALGTSSLLLLPSLQENFSLAAAEALAAGCPVVISPQVALAGAVKECSAGVVAEPTPERFAEAAGALLRDRLSAEAMGRNGRKLVLERFSWEQVTRQMIEVYQRVLRDAKR